MSVQAHSLEILEEAGVPSPQARAIVRAIEIELDGAKDTLATKHDVLALRQEMSEVRHGLEIRIETLRGELRSAIHASAASTTRQMYAALLGQMAVLLGIAYFFVSHLTR